MAKLINQPSLSSLFGKGLGSGLEALAQQKLEQLAQRQPMGVQQQNPLSQLAQLQQPMQPVAQQQVRSQNPYLQSLNELLNPEGNIEEFRVPENVSERQSTELTKLALKEKSQKAKAQADRLAEIEKSTQPYYKETLEKEKSARTARKRLDRMKELIKEGNLPSTTFYSFLSGAESLKGIPYIGGALGALATPITAALRAAQPTATLRDLEEFEKLSNDFIREAKSIYGSRLTNFDVQQFLKLVPTLSQSDSGKLAIIRNLENLYKGEQVRAKALKQVIKEHGGKRPENLELLVEKKAKKKLNALADKFKKGIPIKKEIGTPLEDIVSARERERSKTIREKNREKLQSALHSISPGLASLIEGL
jgi:hypothetical protein